jgi:3-hydroxyacyl-[acyl-carrier-protein] dehydratase
MEPAVDANMSEVTSPDHPLDIKALLELLPHRYPFLLVDRVLELIPMDRVRAYKNLTFNESFFQGHFPGAPVMPGVLIIEAMAQAGIVLVARSLSGSYDISDRLYLFTGIEKARFRRPVRPGDRLDLECSNLRHRINLWKMDCRAYVDGQLAAEAGLTAAAMPREAF